MADEWNVLRGRGEGETKQAADGATASHGAGNKTADASLGRFDRYGGPVSAGDGGTGYGTGICPEETASSREREPLPKSHLVIGLCLLVLVGSGWLFRSEVRGVASWAVHAARGGKVPLAVKAPRLSRLLRLDKPYTWEEFLAVCAEGGAASVRGILEKQPELARSPDGAPLLHVLVARPVNLDVLRAVTANMDAGAVNARDKDGKTALHVAAGSSAGGAVLLALRGLGADPSLRDAKGRLPLAYFLETWGGMPRSVTPEEKNAFSQYGHNVPIPFPRVNGGRPKTRFVPLTDQVGDMDGKRYFSQIAEAQVTVRKAGFPLPPIAAGDVVGPPPDEETELMRSIGGDPVTRMREGDRAKAEPLWKGIRLAEGTGAAMAKFKCLFPEAYPGTVTHVSALLAGKTEQPSFADEWSGWDVPALVRMAVLMRTLQERLAKSGGGKTGAFGGNAFSAPSVSRSLHERGDSPRSRDPLLMTWTLLETAGSAPSPRAAELNFATEVPGRDAEDKGKKKDGAVRGELDNLRVLRGLLPVEVWRKTGRHLVAAAYVADKSREEPWGAGMLPDELKGRGGLAWLRLWGNADPSDQSEPLRAVLEATPDLSPEAAKGVVALILRSGPASTAPGRDGKTPLAFAEDKNLAGEVIAILREGPPSVPPASAETKR